jgi:predicted nucleic acid-binding protein
VKYLLDSNIISELMRPAPDARALKWLERHDADTALSAIVLAELAAGVEALDEGKRKASLSAAWEWARYVREVRKAGLTPPLLDSMIAATARAWGLKVVTRNQDDFPLMEVINPFEDQ